MYIKSITAALAGAILFSAASAGAGHMNQHPTTNPFSIGTINTNTIPTTIPITIPIIIPTIIPTYFPTTNPTTNTNTNTIPTTTTNTNPNNNPTAVPEPGTLALFGLGLAGLGFARRRKTA